MNIPDCYRILGLKCGASVAEVKASYRRLARLYHPDVNPLDGQAHERFIKLHSAYRLLIEAVNTGTETAATPQPTEPKNEPVQPPPQPPATKVTPKGPNFQENPQLSEVERQLKHDSYLQLQQLLKYKRFPRAIALAEGLAQRLPQDVEVRQWQAITYQRLARHLIEEKQIIKARIYLKKALKTDPHNRSLWSEVERDFRRLEQMFSAKI